MESPVEDRPAKPLQGIIHAVGPDLETKGTGLGKFERSLVNHGVSGVVVVPEVSTKAFVPLLMIPVGTGIPELVIRELI